MLLGRRRSNIDPRIKCCFGDRRHAVAASPSASVPDRATTQLEQPKDTAAQENAPTSASSEHTAALDTDKDGKTSRDDFEAGSVKMPPEADPEAEAEAFFKAAAAAPRAPAAPLAHDTVPPPTVSQATISKMKQPMKKAARRRKAATRNSHQTAETDDDPEPLPALVNLQINQATVSWRSCDG